MSKRNPSMEDRALEQRLRREAIESRPEFSETLHRRIAGAVRQFHAHIADVATAGRAATAGRRRRGLAALLAAACLLGAVAIAWQLNRNAQQPGATDNPQQIAGGPSIEDLRVIDQWADRATTRIVATATLKPQAAQLKHDARLVADTLLGPLPVNLQLASDP
jgi:hypothetical protein